MEVTSYFIEPLDVLFLRGNKLFGDPGSFGESMVPPWPSVVAGALRSALLVARGYDPDQFAQGRISGDAELGTPENPGSFRLIEFTPARRRSDGKVEPLFAQPADLAAFSREDGGVEVRRLEPVTPPDGTASSSATRKLAVLPDPSRSKALKGQWLTEEGWRLHLEGVRIQPEQHLLSADRLWKFEMRVGVGLDPGSRAAEDSKLFTAQGVVPRKVEHGTDGTGGFDVGFVVAVAGANMSERLTLRLGGDGRAALSHVTDARFPEPDLPALAQARRCRIVLTSPGLFSEGWKPTGTVGEGRDLWFDLHGVRGRLVAAAVARSTTVSGFDLVHKRPKPALRAVPTGSVYWLEDLEASAGSLRKLAETGLWLESGENTSRWAEGFNRCALGSY